MFLHGGITELDDVCPIHTALRRVRKTLVDLQCARPGAGSCIVTQRIRLSYGLSSCMMTVPEIFHGPDAVYDTKR
jgi:hypothetical protein